MLLVKQIVRSDVCAYINVCYSALVIGYLRYMIMIEICALRLFFLQVLGLFYFYLIERFIKVVSVTYCLEFLMLLISYILSSCSSIGCY